MTSVLVDDQAKALAFYTDVLGFQKKQDVPVGEHRWLTVVSPADPDGPGPVTMAVLDDTCGNLIQIASQSLA